MRKLGFGSRRKSATNLQKKRPKTAPQAKDKARSDGEEPRQKQEKCKQLFQKCQKSAQRRSLLQLRA